MQIEVAEIHSADQRIAADLFRHAAGHCDAAGLGVGLQAGSDVYRITVNVVAFDDDVADVQPHAHADTLGRRFFRFGRGNGALHFHCAGDCRTRVLENCQESVARVLDQGAAIGSNARLKHQRAQAHESRVRATFVRRHQAAESDHISDQNGERPVLGLRGIHCAPHDWSTLTT